MVILLYVCMYVCMYRTMDLAYLNILPVTSTRILYRFYGDFRALVSRYVLLRLTRLQ